MKKKIMSVAMVALMTASLTACGGSAKEETTAPASEAEKTTEAEQSEATEAGSESADTADLGNFEGQELRVSTFSFNAELLQKNVYDPFEKAVS